jgi:cytochrome c biogenesis protein CcdA
MVGTAETATDTDSRTSLRVFLTVGVAAIVAIAGYSGFRFADWLDLGGEAGAGVIALAVVTGLAAFFSPCSFGFLLTLLAGPERAVTGGRRRRDGVAVALAIGAGASLFLLVVGVAVGLLGEGIVQSVGFSTTGGRVLRGAVASVVITAGLVQLGLISIPFWRVTRFSQPIDRRRVAVADRHQHRAHLLYGFGFVVAGFG